MTTADSRTDAAAVRRRNRDIARKRLSKAENDRPAGKVPSSLALIVIIAPTVLAFGAVSIFYPRILANLGAVIALAAAALILLSPFFLVPRWRERRALKKGARTAAPALPAGATFYQVGFGLAEDGVHDTADTGPAAWDRGPARFGAAGLTTSALHLRGPADAALDIALSDVLGAVHSVPAPWLGDGSLDLHLHSGEAIELCTPQHKLVAADLTSAGVRVIRGA
ncbi:hypothetical protein [Streptomyces sp. CA-132043]|uniref:hypothetical protein n=1 Tax=Streptomyces sp. CA-132043 TaxID=3240048 RepID=UPI003D927860